MSFSQSLRKLYFKTTDYTHGFQGRPKRAIALYRLWAFCYDVTVKLDPAYPRELRNMIDSAVRQDDIVLDIGCGTGMSTVYACGIANKVVGIDVSANMLKRLRKKISRRKIDNIEVLHGSFPEALSGELRFDSVISSFAMAHFTKTEVKAIYEHVFGCLHEGGRLGLFLAQGELATTFETKIEIMDNLTSAGFQSIEIRDVSDMYRIVTALKP